jgi:hypothetical protein
VAITKNGVTPLAEHKYGPTAPTAMDLRPGTDGESDLQEAVRCVQPRTPGRSPAKYQQMMAQREVLHLQDSTRLGQQVELDQSSSEA